MQIMIINGSPKLGESTSELLIHHLVSMLGEQIIRVVNVNRGVFTSEDEEYLQKSDALVFVFPLYIDSIPSHLIKLLLRLESLTYQEGAHVYCIVNNGFYEGRQKKIAINQMQLWCRKTNLIWGQGLGSGTGEMIPIVHNIPLGYGPNKSLGQNLNRIADNIINQKSDETILMQLDWPRPFWHRDASRYLWLPKAKKNGLSKKQMYRKMVKE